MEYASRRDYHPHRQQWLAGKVVMQQQPFYEDFYEQVQQEKRAGNTERAIELLEEAASYALAAGEPGKAISCLQEAHEIAEEHGNLKKAIMLLEQAAIIAEQSNDPVMLATVYNSLALLQKQAGDFRGAKTSMEQAIQLMGQFAASAELGTFWTNLAFIVRDMGDLRDALSYLDKAAAIYQQIDSPERKAHYLTELGIVYKDLGQLTRAKAYFDLAFTFLGRRGVSQEWANALVGLGYQLLMQHDRSAARHCYLKALVGYRCIRDRVNEALVLHNLGQMYDNEEQFQLALRYYQRALIINQSLNNLLGIAEDTGSIAALFQVAGKVEQARKLHKQALRIYKAIGFAEGQYHTLIDLGILERDVRYFDTAIKLMTKALTIARSIANPRLLYDGYLNRGDVYHMEGKLQEALQDFSDAVDMSEAIRAYLHTEQEALGYFDESHLEAYDRLVVLSLRGLHSPAKALAWAEQAKSREFLRRLRLSDIPHAEAIPTMLLEREAHLLNRLRQLAFDLATNKSHDSLSILQEYETAEKSLQDIWNRIESFDPEHVSLRRGKPATWMEIKECLLRL
jgi:tetratricopeptide (TPR) repeat protein